jgi:hypothetical protein
MDGTGDDGMLIYGPPMRPLEKPTDNMYNSISITAQRAMPLGERWRFMHSFRVVENEHIKNSTLHKENQDTIPESNGYKDTKKHERKRRNQLKQKLKKCAKQAQDFGLDLIIFAVRNGTFEDLGTSEAFSAGSNPDWGAVFECCCRRLNPKLLPKNIKNDNPQFVRAISALTALNGKYTPNGNKQ